jgi:hypothetical protein
VSQSTNSLEEVLNLPDSGQPLLNQAVPTLDILKDEDSVVSYCRDDGLKSRAIAVVRAVFRSLSRSEDIYAGIWHGFRQFYAPNGTTATRLLNTQDLIVDEADVNSARYRINALLFGFHFRALCDRLERDGLNPKTSKEKSKETMTVESLTKETNRSRDQIHNLLKRGRWYAQWIDRLGVGAILLLGESLA